MGGRRIVLGGGWVFWLEGALCGLLTFNLCAMYVTHHSAFCVLCTSDPYTPHGMHVWSLYSARYTLLTPLVCALCTLDPKQSRLRFFQPYLFKPFPLYILDTPTIHLSSLLFSKCPRLPQIFQNPSNAPKPSTAAASRVYPESSLRLAGLCFPMHCAAILFFGDFMFVVTNGLYRCG